MDKQTVQQLRKELATLLNEFGAEHNLNLSIGNITYDSEGFRTKLEATEVGAVSKIEKDYNLYILGRYPNAPKCGEEFKVGGHTYTVRGYDTKKRKYPILASKGGKNYKFPEFAFLNVIG